MFLAIGFAIIFSIPVKATANGVQLKANRTYTAYDVTGDGTKDKIRIRASNQTDDEAYSSLTVSVNGKTAYRLKNTRFYNVIANIYTLKNGQPFLYLYAPAENGDGPVCALLKYTNGKFRKALDFTEIMAGYGDHRIGEVTNLNGNKIVITESIVSYSLGINAINFTYEYVNGKFVPTSRYGSYKEIYSADGSSRHFTVSNTTLKTGSLTKIIKCALINGKMYIQLECDGEIYWIKALENPPISDNKRQFMEVRYAG